MAQNSENQLLLDRNAALEHVQGDEDFLEEIYQIFLEEIPGRKEEFKKALEKNDIASVVGLAHSLKGVSLTIAAMSCHKTALELEMAAREEDEKKVKELYVQLEGILDQLEQTLTEMFSSD